MTSSGPSGSGGRPHGAETGAAASREVALKSKDCWAQHWPRMAVVFFGAKSSKSPEFFLKTWILWAKWLEWRGQRDLANSFDWILFDQLPVLWDDRVSSKRQVSWIPGAQCSESGLKLKWSLSANKGLTVKMTGTRTWRWNWDLTMGNGLKVPAAVFWTHSGVPRNARFFYLSPSLGGKEMVEICRNEVSRSLWLILTWACQQLYFMIYINGTSKNIDIYRDTTVVLPNTGCLQTSQMLPTTCLRVDWGSPPGHPSSFPLARAMLSLRPSSSFTWGEGKRQLMFGIKSNSKCHGGRVWSQRPGAAVASKMIFAKGQGLGCDQKIQAVEFPMAGSASSLGRKTS